MHAHFLDPYIPRSSLLHQLDGRVKLSLALTLILTAALMPSGAWPAFILLFSLVVSVEALSMIGVGYVWKRAALALPFVLAALPGIFAGAGLSAESLIQIGPVTLSMPGLERFVSIAIKSWISVQVAILLSAVTPFPDLLMSMRALRVPRLMVSLFGLMWRYLFVLADEAMRLMRARAARSGSAEGDQRTGGSVAWRARIAGGMAGNLFLRAFERSDRIYMAMLARGYDGEIRALPLEPLERADWLVLWGGLAACGMLLLISLL